MYANFTCDALKRSSLASKLYSVNDQRVANEQDFDSATGELFKNSSSVLLLDAGYTAKITDWMSGTDASKLSPEFKLVDIETRHVSRKPPAPFITSTLQQEASRKLGLSPSRTMSIAQSLYEEGFITYMRTDSPQLSSTAFSIAQDIVDRTFGAAYLESSATGKHQGKSAKRGKMDERSARAPANAQEAHEAIRPSETAGLFKSPEDTFLSGPARALYALIYKRTLASVMASSKSQTNTYVIEGTKSVDSEIKRVVFRASNTEVLFKGFLAAMEMEDDRVRATESNGLRQVNSGQILRLSTEVASVRSDSDGADNDGVVDLSPLEGETINTRHPGIQGVKHTTRPPSRYSEASFIKELESIGVGRPSTYSKILQILKEREYIIVDKQTIIPTVKGLVVTKMLENHFPELVEAEFTAYMEKCLDLIAQGSQDRVSFLREFYFGEEDDNSAPRGLLLKANHKVQEMELDHKESRVLKFPPIEDLGLIKLGSNDIYLERESEEADKPLRWVLPAEMQEDIRLIDRESIQRILLTEADTSGYQKGTDPASGKPVSIKSGRCDLHFIRVFVMVCSQVWEVYSDWRGCR